MLNTEIKMGDGGGGGGAVNFLRGGRTREKPTKFFFPKNFLLYPVLGKKN